MRNVTLTIKNKSMITILKPTKKNGKKTFFPLKLALKHCLLILLLVNFSPLTAVSIAQPMSIKLKNSNLIELFEVIENNSSYKVVYKEYMKNKKVSANYESEEVETILNETLASVGLTYRIRGRQIVITEAVSPSVTQQDNRITVEGIVVDQNGESLIGVTIVDLSNEKNMSVTDIEGKFSMKVKPGSKLKFSYVGYMSIDQEVSTSMRVVMKENAKVLDEVVVVGFGKQKKESVTGAISTISADNLMVPSSNLSTAFAGRIAGVISVQRSGEPGADGASFWIRGISTFSNATQPLIYIDGVEVSSADMNSLAPELIENFSVLKDASATALYGARGANGVILITTRSGQKNQRTSINVRVEGKLSQPVKTVEFADGVKYMEMYNEARTARGGDVYFSSEKIENTRNNVNPYIFPNVDWQDFLFKDWSFNQSANLSVTGGGNKISYFLNAGINNDNGMIRKEPTGKFNNNVRQQQFSFQGNISADLTSTTKASLRFSTRILEKGGSRISTADLYSTLFETVPVLFAPYYPNTMGADHVLFGNLSGGPHPQGEGQDRKNLYKNVFADMSRGYTKNSQNTNIATFSIDQKLDFLTDGLSIGGLASFKNWSNTGFTRSFEPAFYEIGDNYWQNEDGSWGYDPKRLTIGTTALSISDGTGLADRYSTGDRYINLQASINYARVFNEKHDVSGMFVYLQRDYNRNNPKASNSTGTYYNTLSVRNQGIAGRLTYGYDNRYMAELNFGYNGSENFQDGKRFGFFPSVSVGYNIANEKYWESLKDFIPVLKIRGSWGVVGNSSTDGRFPYLTFVNLSGKGFNFGKEMNNYDTGAIITRYGAEGAGWEEGDKLNLGLDFAMQNGLSGSLDIYRETRKGIFMKYGTLPIESGISSSLIPFANLGKVKNEGFDLSLEYNKAFLNNDLILSFKGNVTYAKNTLLDRDVPEDTPAYMSEVGRSLNLNKGLIALGLFKDQEEIDASPTQTYSKPAPGDIKYADLNNDGLINNDDKTYIGNPTSPQLVYGFGLSASYKKIDFSVFFQGVGKTSITMGNIHPFNAQYSQLYQFIADDYWSESNPNPNAAYPRLVTEAAPETHNNHQTSTYWLRDGSFLRLKNLEIGYRTKYARIYLSGQNLFTFSSFKHWDPEMGGMTNSSYSTVSARGLKYPTLRTFSLGVQFNF